VLNTTEDTLMCSPCLTAFVDVVRRFLLRRLSCPGCVIIKVRPVHGVERLPNVECSSRASKLASLHMGIFLSYVRTSTL